MLPSASLNFNTSFFLSTGTSFFLMHLQSENLQSEFLSASSVVNLLPAFCHSYSLEESLILGTQSHEGLSRHTQQLTQAHYMDQVPLLWPVVSFHELLPRLNLSHLSLNKIQPVSSLVPEEENTNYHVAFLNK